MNPSQLLSRLDGLQRRHHALSFTYAVIKAYSEDLIGHQAVLLTYYAFLSLFPLLLVLTTLTQVIANTFPHVQATIIHGTTASFPVLGSQLSAHVHGLHKSGLALIAGLLITLYGARGIATTFYYGLNRLWHVPLKERDGFPQTLFKSFTIMLVGGLGLVAASTSAGLAAASGHGLVFWSLSVLVNAFILFWLFVFLFRLCLPKRVSHYEVQLGALLAAAGLIVLQLVGGYILAHELKSLDALYSYFALALGLIFWIYLQVQVMYYSAEIARVKSSRLWPRSLDGRQLTDADKQLLVTHRAE